MTDQPLSHFPHGQPVPHRHRTRTDKTFPSFDENCPFDRPARRIGPVQNPYRLAVLGGGFQNISQRRDKRIDSATQILKVDQDDVKGFHRLRGWSTDLAVQAEHWDIVNRIKIILGFDHIVLLVTPQTVLGSKSRGNIDTVETRQHIKRMGQIAGDRGRMRKQRHPLPFKSYSEFGLFDKPVYSKFHRDSAISIL